MYSPSIFAGTANFVKVLFTVPVGITALPNTILLVDVLAILVPTVAPMKSVFDFSIFGFKFPPNNGNGLSF